MESPSTLSCVPVFVGLDLMVLENGLGSGVEGYWRNKNKNQCVGRTLVSELLLIGFVILVI